MGPENGWRATPELYDPILLILCMPGSSERRDESLAGGGVPKVIGGYKCMAYGFLGLCRFQQDAYAVHT